MRLPLLPVLIVLVVGLLADWYILRRIRRSTARPSVAMAWFRSVYIIVAAIATLGMAVVAFMPKKSADDAWLGVFMWSIFTYFSIYIPKYLFVIFSVIRQGASALFHRPLRAITIVGAALSFLLFVFLWWGALVTRFNIDVRHVDVDIKGLPKGFEGYSIVQISDLHTGTYGGDPRFLEKMVERVNSLKPDIILFTGDIVNRHSSELIPYMATLSGLSAPDGVWSVMGNHDYGEYYRWPSEADRLADVGRLKSMQGAMGWKMLNNDHAILRHGADSIVLIGVENIGDPPFTTYGDLRRAYPRLDDPSTKILMSHNPAHWTDSVADSPDINIALTLSGHTHAMQIELLGWSPASMRYHTWGGLYSDSLHRKLYVNIGLGEVGFPSRIGATPEITLITLKGADAPQSQ